MIWFPGLRFSKRCYLCYGQVRKRRSWGCPSENAEACSAPQSLAGENWSHSMKLKMWSVLVTFDFQISLFLEEEGERRGDGSLSESQGRSLPLLQAQLHHPDTESSSHLRVLICRNWAPLKLLHHPDLISVASLVDCCSSWCQISGSSRCFSTLMQPLFWGISFPLRSKRLCSNHFPATITCLVYSRPLRRSL